jgi:hypothetical protein
MEVLVDEIEKDIRVLTEEMRRIYARLGIRASSLTYVQSLERFVSGTQSNEGIKLIRSSLQTKQNRRPILLLLHTVYETVRRIRLVYGEKDREKCDLGAHEDFKYSELVDTSCKTICDNLLSLRQLLLAASDFRASLEQINTTLIKLSDS